MGDNGGPMDYYNLKLEKAPATFDQPHMFKAFLQYELPFGKGRTFSTSWKVVDAVFGGWGISGIFNYFSGGPLGFGGASSPLPSGWNGGQRPNIAAGNMKVDNYDQGAFNFANTSAATTPTSTRASSPTRRRSPWAPPRCATGRSAGSAPRARTSDCRRTSALATSFRAQVRGEFLNLFNRHVLGGINTTITNSLFGQVTSVSGNRTIQLGLRMDF